MKEMNLDTSTKIALIALIFTSVTAVFTAVSLYFAYRLVRMKSGVRLRGGYSTCSSISCEDNYLASITLENAKDRAITIFEIYMKLGNNYYVRIEDFEDKPLILKPFETYHKDYDPIIFYELNMRRVFLNKLFKDKKVKHQLFVSTSEGKKKVRGMKRWNPVLDSLRNYMIAVVQPVRSIYKDRAYGSNVKYLIELKYDDKHEEVIPIYPRDYELRKFRKFQLTKDALKTKECLENFLDQQKAEGNLSSSSFEVHDFQEWKKESFELEKMESYEAEYFGKFRVYVLGLIESKIQDYKMNKKNKELARKRNNKT